MVPRGRIELPTPRFSVLRPADLARLTGQQLSEIPNDSGPCCLYDNYEDYEAFAPNGDIFGDSAELSPRTFRTFTRELSSRRRTPRIVVEELSGASERSKIIPMRTSARLQQRYDHRLRDLVHRTGDVTIATDLGVPRSTARGWLRRAPAVVVSLDVTHLSEVELQQEILQLRRRVQKLAALLRLALALLQASGFTLSRERLPDGRAKMRILRAVDRARGCIPLRALLQFLRLSPRRFHAWRRRQTACALDDQTSCPRTAPHRLTRPEVQAIEDMVTSPDYRHVPTGTLAVLAQRLGRVWASPSTWYRLVRTYGWRRPRLRVHPAKPKIGLRTTRTTRCGTSPPSSVCSTGPAPISMP